VFSRATARNEVGRDLERRRQDGEGKEVRGQGRVSGHETKATYPPRPASLGQHGRRIDMDLDYREGVSPAVSHSGQEESTARKSAEAGAKLAAEMKVFEQVVLELSANRNKDASHDARCSQVLREASELFGVAPTWTAFYRATLGVEGCIRQLFPTADEMCAYECSDAHEKVLEMLTVLRSRDVPECDPCEPQRMITVRIPKSLHDSICLEANDLQVSVNKLCVTRMLQRVDRQLIPTSTQKRRGRRPGAEYTKTSTSVSTGGPITNSPLTDGMDAA
jgi:hypothetical protein